MLNPNLHPHRLLGLWLLLRGTLRHLGGDVELDLEEMVVTRSIDQ
jgi:hypothetical protein